MLAAGLTVAAAVPAGAASWETTLHAAAAGGSDFFGEAVALSGDTVVAGAKLADAGGFDRGAAYVFVRTGSGWVEQQRLVAADGANSDHFGTSVAVSRDTVLIGAPGDDDAGNGSGSAYVFTRAAGRWVQTAKIAAPDGTAGDDFGRAVALDGDDALVGARLDDDRASDGGSAHVFRRSGGTWQHERTLVPADGQSGDLFGTSVAVSDGQALIGAYADDDTAQDAGSAYVFSRGAAGWEQQAKLLAPDGGASDLFGFSVSLSYGTAVVGAFADDDVAHDAGSAHVFERVGRTWVHEATLRAADADRGDVFGRAVAVAGAAVLVGASGDDSSVADAGAVYAFERRTGGWQQTAKLAAPEPAPADLLGYAVALDGEVGAVGVPLDDDRATNAGAVQMVTGLADLAPPTISARVDPPPGAAGWHSAGPVTVIFTCADRGSGVASCTAPVVVSAEPGSAVTGTAVDHVGHSAAVTAEVRLDTTPPAVAVDEPSQVPGVPVPTETVTGTASDALSGVERVDVTFTHAVAPAEQSRTASLDGDRWQVSAEGLLPGPTWVTATATDAAGHETTSRALLVLVAH